ncbi:MAG: DNA translocase FtsK, partial [Planctomycetia bacterium]|nr:DNA translocase FtsK [Planctomycetia bacterium]
YQSIPHLMYPPVTDMHKAEAILGWAVEKMEERYQLLSRLKVRNIRGYNALGEAEIRSRLGRVSPEELEKYPPHMPYFVLVADEMADLMMTAPKEVESHIIRLAQKSRAVGIHLVLATQKPTVNIITGLIKSNMPARICFKVFSLTDSRVILDQSGGEKLLGQGDMLYMGPSSGTLQRGQGTFLSDDEINRVIETIAVDEPDYVQELEHLQSGDEKNSGMPADRDERYFESVDFVVREGKASTSLLQRTLGLGYGRAARIIDHMFEDGIVGPSSPTRGREVLISPLQWDRMKQSWIGGGPMNGNDGGMMEHDDESFPDARETNIRGMIGAVSPFTPPAPPERLRRTPSLLPGRNEPDLRANRGSAPIGRTSSDQNPFVAPSLPVPQRPRERRPNRIVLGERTPDPFFDLNPPGTDSSARNGGCTSVPPSARPGARPVLRPDSPDGDYSAGNGGRTSVPSPATRSDTRSTLRSDAPDDAYSSVRTEGRTNVPPVTRSGTRTSASVPAESTGLPPEDDFQWYESVAGRLNSTGYPGTTPQNLTTVTSSGTRNPSAVRPPDEEFPEDDEFSDDGTDIGSEYDEEYTDGEYDDNSDGSEPDREDNDGRKPEHVDGEERELWEELETMWDPPEFPTGTSRSPSSSDGNRNRDDTGDGERAPERRRS